MSDISWCGLLVGEKPEGEELKFQHQGDEVVLVGLSGDKARLPDNTPVLLGGLGFGTRLFLGLSDYQLWIEAVYHRGQDSTWWIDDYFSFPTGGIENRRAPTMYLRDLFEAKHMQVIVPELSADFETASIHSSVEA